MVNTCLFHTSLPKIVFCLVKMWLIEGFLCKHQITILFAPKPLNKTLKSLFATLLVSSPEEKRAVVLASSSRKDYFHLSSCWMLVSTSHLETKTF